MQKGKHEVDGDSSKGATSCRHAPPRLQGADMGDKGGKKDKNKNKQQALKKHQRDEQRKQDKAPRPT